MGAAASAISQQDLTNEEKTVITKVPEFGILNYSFLFLREFNIKLISVFD